VPGDDLGAVVELLDLTVPPDERDRRHRTTVGVDAGTITATDLA